MAIVLHKEVANPGLVQQTVADTNLYDWQDAVMYDMFGKYIGKIHPERRIMLRGYNKNSVFVLYNNEVGLPFSTTILDTSNPVDAQGYIQFTNSDFITAIRTGIFIRHNVNIINYSCRWGIQSNKFTFDDLLEVGSVCASEDYYSDFSRCFAEVMVNRMFHYQFRYTSWRDMVSRLFSENNPTTRLQRMHGDPQRAGMEHPKPTLKLMFYKKPNWTPISNSGFGITVEQMTELIKNQALRNNWNQQVWPGQIPAEEDPDGAEGLTGTISEVKLINNLVDYTLVGRSVVLMGCYSWRDAIGATLQAMAIRDMNPNIAPPLLTSPVGNPRSWATHWYLYTSYSGSVWYDTEVNQEYCILTDGYISKSQAKSKHNPAPGTTSTVGSVVAVVGTHIFCDQFSRKTT